MSALTVPASDTTLHVVDTPGGNPPLVFLNGGFGTLRDWSPVIDTLAGRHRTVRFDARARGRSGRSTDYSLASAVDDVGRVIEATGVERPILVGWSHGATLAVRYAMLHPQAVAGLVLVDGAFPIVMFDEPAKVKARAQFRRLAFPMRVAAAFGLSARLSAEEATNVLFEMDEANGELDFAALTCPTLYVVGSGPHAGATPEEVARMRSATTKATLTNYLVSVFDTVPANHVQVLRQAPDTVAAAIAEVAG
jgi:pimeloyl-ACP methyl ester carboxylesterase